MCSDVDTAIPNVRYFVYIFGCSLICSFFISFSMTHRSKSCSCAWFICVTNFHYFLDYDLFRVVDFLPNELWKGLWIVRWWNSITKLCAQPFDNIFFYHGLGIPYSASSSFFHEVHIIENYFPICRLKMEYFMICCYARVKKRLWNSI